MDDLLLLSGWCAGLFAVCGIAQAIYNRVVLRRDKDAIDKATVDLLRRYR